MGKTLFEIFQILFIFWPLYLAYYSFNKSKYESSKRFIWSKKDLQIPTLKGYHFYGESLIWLYLSVSWLLDVIQYYKTIDQLETIKMILFYIILIYGIISAIKIKKQDKLDKKIQK